MSNGEKPKTFEKLKPSAGKFAGEQQELAREAKEREKFNESLAEFTADQMVMDALEKAHMLGNPNDPNYWAKVDSLKKTSKWRELRDVFMSGSKVTYVSGKEGNVIIGLKNPEGLLLVKNFKFDISQADVQPKKAGFMTDLQTWVEKSAIPEELLEEKNMKKLNETLLKMIADFAGHIDSFLGDFATQGIGQKYADFEAAVEELFYLREQGDEEKNIDLARNDAIKAGLGYGREVKGAIKEKIITTGRLPGAKELLALKKGEMLFGEEIFGFQELADEIYNDCLVDPSISTAISDKGKEDFYLELKTMCAIE